MAVKYKQSTEKHGFKSTLLLFLFCTIKILPLKDTNQDKLQMKEVLILLMLFMSNITLKAETMNINRVKYAGFPLLKPFIVENTDVNSKSFDIQTLLDAPLSFEVLADAPYMNIEDIAAEVPDNNSQYILGLISFSLQNERYTTAGLKISGVQNYIAFLDGNKIGTDEFVLEPSTHTINIKYILPSESRKEALSIAVETKKEGVLSLRSDNKRSYTIKDVLHGTRFSDISISPDGKYLITRYNTTLPEGKTESYSKVTDLATGNTLAQTTESIAWMPVSNRYYYTSQTPQGRALIAVEPATGTTEILAKNIPDGQFVFAPTEEYLVFTLSQEGPAEKKEIYQVITPDDRQPGWRTRSYPAKYDLATGVMQQLTFGYNNVSVADISSDGKHILIITTKSRLTERPTTLYSLYLLNTETLEAEALIENDGFLNRAILSPDGKKVLVCGSPEALGGIGKTVKEGQTPSMYDFQLYIMEIQSKKITPVTKEFNPSVQRFVWSRADGNIYFTAENRDMISLYKMTPSGYKIEEIDTQEDIVTGFSIASGAPVLAYCGQGASNSDRSYIVDMRKGKNTKTESTMNKTTMFEDLSKKILEGIELGECIGWEFKNSKGDIINGRYYLPPHFDANKKYPLIVDYYGGCSPTSRTFESRYPQHAYAALGYVMLVINPSGATGFGQEFSARHVNSAGKGPAEDIIEGVKQFCKEHSFVNAEKIGCIGASYGGFMTQYLQTQTDIFAAAISHAGISDHTSYWGEGYWGYSYSEVAMAGSYPWSHRELYVNQSPLYNAEKINTPILFLHGDADTNVPVGESIQMYTALKLLGKETAMVLVKEQDHHIKEYNKRIQWQNTIWAWFAKWLQDDPTWWDAMYPPKSL